MSKVCLTLVLLALAYVVSRAADADKEISDGPATGIPLKYDPSDESSDDESEEEDDKSNPVETEEPSGSAINVVTKHMCTIKDTIAQLEQLHKEGKKTPPETEAPMQAILKDAANKGPFYVRTQQAKTLGTALQKDCFFHVDEDMTKLMFSNYANLEECANTAKAAYTGAMRKLDTKAMRTKGKLLLLTQIRNQCEDPFLDKMNDCLVPYLPKFLRTAILVKMGASKAQGTFAKRMSQLNDNYKTCTSQANSTLYEKLEPLRTAAEQCVHK